MKKEVVIIGGGPAGLSAAIEIAKHAPGNVLLIDENKSAGGQLFKQIHKFFGSKAHDAGVRGIDIGQRMREDAQRLGVEIWLDSAVIGLFAEKKVAVLRGGTTVSVDAERVLVCTGASENAISFPGWTLPGVMGAGAAQTMTNVRRVLPGQKILMVGSGNVGVIVSYQLVQAGAEVVGIVEAMPRIGAYGVHASKVRRAGVPFYLGHTIMRAEGEGHVERAVITAIDEKFQPIPGTEKQLDVDVICLAAGLRPMTELAWMRGVEHAFIPAMGGWMPLHNEDMESSVPGIYVAGDTAGVEEANTAIDEGRLAGVAIAQSLGMLGEAEARAKKQEIRARLTALRQGPFGERRQAAKQQVIKGGTSA